MATKAGTELHEKNESNQMINESSRQKNESNRQKSESKHQESVYTVAEFAANSRAIFGANRECVEAALKTANVISCTVSKAKEIVAAFMKKEVK